MNGKKGGSRARKVAEEIKKVISESLLRGDVGSYENINPTMIVVTDVVVSDCLQHAKIFISTLSEDVDPNLCLKFLEHHSPQIRKIIGCNIRLKFVPEVNFYVDNSFEYAKKIENLLKSLR